MSDISASAQVQDGEAGTTGALQSESNNTQRIACNTVIQTCHSSAIQAKTGPFGLWSVTVYKLYPG